MGPLFNEDKKDASVQVIANLFNLMLNAKLQARGQLIPSAVKFVLAVSYVGVKEELRKLVKEGSAYTGTHRYAESHL